MIVYKVLVLLNYFRKLLWDLTHYKKQYGHILFCGGGQVVQLTDTCLYSNNYWFMNFLECGVAITINWLSKFAYH